MPRRTGPTLARAACALLAASLSIAHAQEWPARPVTMIVPYAAGGPVDTVARIVSARLSDVLRQQVVIENIGGAGGMLGTQRVAKATPDGYTVLLGGLAVLANVPHLYRKLPYDPVGDFTPVALFADSARILIARKDFPASTLQEFVAYAKANQSKMQYGSAGPGSGLHICAVLLDSAMGTSITHVPYRGSALAVRDLIAGRLDFMADQISTALPMIQSGSVKAIATMGAVRPPSLPDLPTTAEAGFADLDCGTWSAFVFPRGTPAAIVQRLYEATNETVDTPAVRERLGTVGVTVIPRERRAPEYLAGFIRREFDKWAAPIRASGVTAD